MRTGPRLRDLPYMLRAKASSNSKSRRTMEKNYTPNNATVSTNSFDSNFPAREIMDLATKSCQVCRNTRVWRMCEEDLEDLIQDTVYKAVKYWNSFDPSKSHLGTWVSRIARNCWNDAYRKEMRRLGIFEPLVSENKEGDEFIDSEIEFAAGGYSADRELESREAVDRINSVVDSLPENQGYILSLSANEGLKPRHMAEQIGCSAGAASTLLCRARKAVAKRLGKDFLADHGFAA